MNRREVIQSLGIISLHALFPSVLAGFISSCQSGAPVKTPFMFFDEKEQVLIKELIDLIIPATSTRSASEVGVHYFLDEVFAHCLHQDQKELIKEGLSQLKESWYKEKDKTKLVENIDEKAFNGNESAAWFKTIKRYTLIGFFTSEEGTTKAGDYQKIPDQFTGEVLINEHTKAHSKTFLKFYL